MAITDAMKAAGWPTSEPEHYETFLYGTGIVYSAAVAGGSVSVGLAVTTQGQAAQTVDLVGNLGKVDGKLIKVEADGYCTVQTHGKCTLPGGDGAALTVGSKFVGDLDALSASGYIQTAAALSGASDSTITAFFKARGKIVDASTTTAVWVDLDK